MIAIQIRKIPANERKYKSKRKVTYTFLNMAKHANPPK